MTRIQNLKKRTILYSENVTQELGKDVVKDNTKYRLS